MPSFTERTNIDDVIRHEYYEGYCRKAVTLHNRTGSAISKADVMMQPVQVDSGVSTDYMFLQAGQESYCVGLCMHRGSFAVTNLANAGTIKTKILCRGPVIVDKNFIPTTDVLGAALTLATLVTALQALNPPIVCNAEVSGVVTQST